MRRRSNTVSSQLSVRVTFRSRSCPLENSEKTIGSSTASACSVWTRQRATASTRRTREVSTGRTLIEAAVAEYPGAEVAIERLLLAEPLLPTEASRKLGETIADAAAEVSGAAVRLHGVPLYTDARHYARAGVPTVLYGAGPKTIEEANAHSADEQLRLTDLGLATEVVALALARLLGAG